MPKQKGNKRIQKRISNTGKGRPADKTEKSNRKRTGLAHKSQSPQHGGRDGIIGGIFCEVYGDSIENRVKEEFLTFRNSGVAVSDIVESAYISKPKAYQVVYKFLEMGFVKKFRKIGGTQLYVLNEDNHLVKIWLLSYDFCMKMGSSIPGKAKIALNS